MKNGENREVSRAGDAGNDTQESSNGTNQNCENCGLSPIDPLSVPNRSSIQRIFNSSSERDRQLPVFRHILLGLSICLTGLTYAASSTSDQTYKSNASTNCPQRGLQIPPKIKNTLIGDIPGWEKSYSSEILQRVKANTEAYGQKIVSNGKSTCMVLEYIQQNRRLDILDAVDISKIYPRPNRIPKHFKSGSGWVEQGNCYVLSRNKTFDPNTDERIIGLTLPTKGKEDCSHYSRWVLGAWRVDFDAQRYIPVAPDTLICDRPEAGDSCY